MGGLFKSKPVKQESNPWAPQGDALKGVFTDAKNLYESRKDTPFFQGDLYAGMDGLTSQGINANADYATGAGADLASNIAGAGSGLFGAGQSGLGAYDRLAAMAGQDPTKANIAAAGQYADNPYMDGMIDAASRDVRRNLTENQIPGLNMAATGSGNMNSSRAGIAEGIMRRGAADSVADISANLRGNAYSQGLGLASGERANNMNALATAGSGYGSMFGQGLNAAGMGADLAYQNNDALIRGGMMKQADAQGQLDADYKKWLGQDTRSTDLLNQYYGIVGGNNWGGTQTQKGGGASPFSQIVGGASSMLGAYMMSDPRAKVNVRKVGTRDDGLNVYDFDYRQDLGVDLPTGRQRGVMANEVAELRPDALGPRVGGFLTVDYGALDAPRAS